MSIFSHLCIAVLFSIAAVAAMSPASAITLAKDGETEYVIVIAADAIPAEKTPLLTPRDPTPTNRNTRAARTVPPVAQVWASERRGLVRVSVTCITVCALSIGLQNLLSTGLRVAKLI